MKTELLNEVLTETEQRLFDDIHRQTFSPKDVMQDISLQVCYDDRVKKRAEYNRAYGLHSSNPRETQSHSLLPIYSFEINHMDYFSCYSTNFMLGGSRGEQLKAQHIEQLSS